MSFQIKTEPLKKKNDREVISTKIQVYDDTISISKTSWLKAVDTAIEAIKQWREKYDIPNWHYNNDTVENKDIVMLLNNLKDNNRSVIGEYRFKTGDDIPDDFSSITLSEKSISLYFENSDDVESTTWYKFVLLNDLESLKMNQRL